MARRPGRHKGAGTWDRTANPHDSLLHPFRTCQSMSRTASCPPAASEDTPGRTAAGPKQERAVGKRLGLRQGPAAAGGTAPPAATPCARPPPTHLCDLRRARDDALLAGRQQLAGRNGNEVCGPATGARCTRGGGDGAPCHTGAGGCGPRPGRRRAGSHQETRAVNCTRPSAAPGASLTVKLPSGVSASLAEAGQGSAAWRMVRSGPGPGCGRAQASAGRLSQARRAVALPGSLSGAVGGGKFQGVAARGVDVVSVQDHRIAVLASGVSKDGAHDAGA